MTFEFPDIFSSIVACIRYGYLEGISCSSG